MLYELRIYKMQPGRLPAIHQRFKNATLALFKKHGIKVCDFYEDATGQEAIYYICAFPDRPSRDRAFAAFRADPDWQAALTASHADGEIVASVQSIFMERVPYVQPCWDQEDDDEKV